MGVDQSIMFGPYAECSWTGSPALKEERFCPGGHHQASSANAFCPKCGATILTRSAQAGYLEHSFDKAKMEDEIDDAMYEPMSMSGEIGEDQIDYWVANKYVPAMNKRKDSIEKYEEGVFPFDPDTILKEVVGFEEFFSKELAILRKNYDTVKVRWGIISYCC